MTRQKACFQFVVLVMAIMLLVSAIGLVACTKQPTAAPSMAPTPAQTPAPKPEPAPGIAPVPSQKPEEAAKEITTTPAHHFWGQIKTDTGDPAPGVVVTAWINSEQRGSITTDGSGQYGSDPLAGLPYYLNVTGSNGDIIEFRVDGITADETRWGVLIEEGTPYWQRQDVASSWQVIYNAGEVNSLDLVYTPDR